MKRSFTNIDVECWEEHARLGTTSPTICLSHAEAALGREIVEAIDELAAEAPVANRKVTFKPSLRKRPIDTLRLRFVPERPGLRVINIARNDNAVTIELTVVGLGLMRDAVIAWLNGSEDFGVGPDHADIKRRDLGDSDKASLELWFWGPTMNP